MDDYTDGISTVGVVPINGEENGELEAPGDDDWFRVSLSSGTTYVFGASGADGGGGDLPDPYLRLYDAQGLTELAANDDSADPNSVLDSRFEYTATATGDYFLSVESYPYAASLTGTYTVSATTDTTDPNGGGEEPDPFAAVGKSVTGEIVTAGEAVEFATELTAGTRYVVDLEGADSGQGTLADPYLRLLDDQGTALRANDNAGIGRDARIEFVAPQDGLFSFQADTLDPAGSGGFTLTVSAVQRGGAGADQLLGTDDSEHLLGLGGNDVLRGGGERDHLVGGAGADTLLGQAGDDVLFGGPGADLLAGAAGSDALVFTGPTQGVDRVIGFELGPDGDRIVLDAVLRGYDPGVDDLNDYLSFDDQGTAARLSVDPDGSGPVGSFVLATLVGRAGATVDALLADGNLVIV